jgi:hypothetical protein
VTGVAFETPLYMQNAPAPQYPARLDRRLIQFVFRSQERVLEGLVVSQKSGVQDNTVDITAGVCLVMGDDIARQGLYLVMSNDAEYTAGKVNLALPAKPASGLLRIDSVMVRVRDSQAIGTGTSVDAIVDYVSGATASSNPPLPTIPASCLLLDHVLRSGDLERGDHRRRDPGAVPVRQRPCATNRHRSSWRSVGGVVSACRTFRRTASR